MNFEHSNSLSSIIILLYFYLKNIASPLDKYSTKILHLIYINLPQSFISRYLLSARKLYYKCILTVDSLNICNQKEKQQSSSAFFLNFEYSNSLSSIISSLCFYLKDIAFSLDKDSSSRLYINPLQSFISRYLLFARKLYRTSVF